MDQHQRVENHQICLLLRVHLPNSLELTHKIDISYESNYYVLVFNMIGLYVLWLFFGLAQFPLNCLQLDYIDIE